MKKDAKSLASKIQVDVALDITKEKREYIKKIQMFDLSYFNGRKYFDSDWSQNCLKFQPFSNTLRK